MNDARHDPAADGEHTRYDLRTATQHEADALAALNLRVDNLVDANEYLTHRVAVLEAEARTLRAAVNTIADAVTVITLRGDDGR